MKKFFISVLILLLLAGGFFCYKWFENKKEQERIEKIKEGWYVEVLNDTIKIRKEADRNSSELGEAKKGNVFAVTKFEKNNGNFWYFVEYKDGKYGWIGNPYNTTYLKDGNNPQDTRVPTLIYFADRIYADTIDKIEYRVLKTTYLDYDEIIVEQKDYAKKYDIVVFDDRPETLEVTHQVFHEVDDYKGTDQYWIQYTVKDAVGKSYKKVQAITFNKRPDESKVEDFVNLER